MSKQSNMMKNHRHGLAIMSIAGLMGVLSLELGEYIHHSIGVIGVLFSAILMLIGTILSFRTK